jgi:hypothetical protein
MESAAMPAATLSDVLRHLRHIQATFLVLVRRAYSIWKHKPLGGWLCGVAQRIARRAMQLLEQIATAEARHVLDILSTGPLMTREAEEAQEALARLTLRAGSAK